MADGIIHNGIFYHENDIKRAFCQLNDKMELNEINGLMGSIENNDFPSFMEILIKKEVLPKPYRENNEGIMAYPVFLARDIWKEIEEMN